MTYALGDELLVLVGSNTLTFNNASVKTEVPILNRETVPAQNPDWSKAPGQYFSMKLKHLWKAWDSLPFSRLRSSRFWNKKQDRSERFSPILWFLHQTSYGATNKLSGAQTARSSLCFPQTNCGNFGPPKRTKAGR